MVYSYQVTIHQQGPYARGLIARPHTFMVRAENDINALHRALELRATQGPSTGERVSHIEIECLGEVPR